VVSLKYCPSAECPYALRHHESQEYRDEVVTCADCGAALTVECRTWPVATAESRDIPWGRLALTLVAPLLIVWVASRLSLPRIDAAEIEHTLGASGRARLMVLSLGLGPFLSAFFLVELAALSVPRWRPLRNGGPLGRGRLLTATTKLGLALAAVQALGVAVYLGRLGLLEKDARLSRLVVVLTLVTGTCLLFGLAHLLDRVALGGGFALLTTAFSVASALPVLSLLKRDVPGLLMIVVVCAGSVIVLRWRPDHALPLPACGVVPLVWSAALVSGALALSEFGIWREPLRSLAAGGGVGALSLAIAVAAAVGLGFLFNRPSKVAAFDPDAAGYVTRSVALSAAFVLGLGILGRLLAHRLMPDCSEARCAGFSLIPLVAVTALLLDVIAEARAVRQHSELVSVWPEHRLYAVDSAVAMLARSGIPAFPGSVHQRALWHFFAPFIPIQIMVPRAQAEEAARLLQEHLLARQ
jgi:hypothetical protein